MLRYKSLLVLCTLVATYPLAIHAASGNEGGTSADEIAKQLANPNTTLGSLSFNLDHIAYEGSLPGADSQNGWNLAFQPSLPYKINESMNLFMRPLIPLVIDRPVPVNNTFESREWELGDISFDTAVGKTFPNGMILVGGVVGTLPTATDDALGLDQWLLGPEFLVAKVGAWGAVGVLVTHQWDIAGEDSFDTSISGGQYFFTYNLKNAWQIQASPTFSYNHNAASGQELTFPLGIGVSKTVVLGKTPWKFQLQYWNYIEKPDAFGPDYQIRFTVTPVVPLPW